MARQGNKDNKETKRNKINNKNGKTMQTQFKQILLWEDLDVVKEHIIWTQLYK